MAVKKTSTEVQDEQNTEKKTLVKSKTKLAAKQQKVLDKTQDESKPKTTKTRAKKEKVGELVYSDEAFINSILGILDEKKAQHISLVDLRQVQGASFDYFVICEAQSTTQVSSLGEAVEVGMKKIWAQHPLHAEGYQNSEWILLDYGGILVHVFLDEIRDFYRLESLWGDAQITQHGTE